MFSELYLNLLSIFGGISYTAAGVLTIILIMHLDRKWDSPIKLSPHDIGWFWFFCLLGWPFYLIYVGIKIANQYHKNRKQNENHERY